MFFGVFVGGVGVWGGLFENVDGVGEIFVDGFVIWGVARLGVLAGTGEVGGLV